MKEQINSLIAENEELKKEILELQEENKSLWFMLDEQKKARDSLGKNLEKVIRDRLEEEIFKSIKPVGDA